MYQDYRERPRDRFVGERMEPAILFLLCLVTCGIYYYYFIYKVSKETLAYTGEQDIDPGMDVLLTFLTCGLWIFYWDYKIGQRIARMQAEAGLPVADNAILYIILNLLGVGFINSLIEQAHLNDIWSRS